MDARDEGVLHLRQHPLLGEEAFAASGRERGIAEHLHRHPARQVMPLGQIDRAHPAAPDQPEDPVGAELPGGGFAQHRLRGVAQVAIEQGIGAGVFRKHGAHATDERGILVLVRGEICLARAFRLFQRGVEESLQSLPGGGRHPCRISSASQARAARQSR